MKINSVSIALAAALIEVDSVWSEQWLARWPRLFGAGAAGARGMFSKCIGWRPAQALPGSSKTWTPTTVIIEPAIVARNA